MFKKWAGIIIIVLSLKNRFIIQLFRHSPPPFLCICNMVLWTTTFLIADQVLSTQSINGICDIRGIAIKAGNFRPSIEPFEYTPKPNLDELKVSSSPCVFFRHCCCILIILDLIFFLKITNWSVLEMERPEKRTWGNLEENFFFPCFLTQKKCGICNFTMINHIYIWHGIQATTTWRT